MLKDPCKSPGRNDVEKSLFLQTKKYSQLSANKFVNCFCDQQARTAGDHALQVGGCHGSLTHMQQTTHPQTTSAHDPC